MNGGGLGIGGCSCCYDGRETRARLGIGNETPVYPCQTVGDPSFRINTNGHRDCIHAMHMDHDWIGKNGMQTGLDRRSQPFTQKKAVRLVGEGRIIADRHGDATPIDQNEDVPRVCILQLGPGGLDPHGGGILERCIPARALDEQGIGP